MYFIQPSNEDIHRALESWDWIDFSDKKPIMISCFGDIFFQSESGIYFLDTLEGTLNIICDDQEELQRLLNTEDGQDTYLLAGLVMRAQDEGLMLNKDECYDFTLSPVLGGEIAFENMTKLDFVVSVHISGQLHKQVKDLPPGTKINDIKIVEPE